MAKFNIPVVVFMFKRKKVVEVLKRISEVQPSKLYLIADYGRNAVEKKQADECRTLVEDSINWECEIVRNYSLENRGVYQNIGEGAKWVFEREQYAIFLEDDNLPEISFFYFCEEMLNKYRDDYRILWICGTNYLGNYQSPENHSYVFTKHMLPCGWASWSNKFLKFYDGHMKLYSKNNVEKMKKSYVDKRLYQQYKGSWTSEYYRIKEGEKPISWDYQMDFSIKVNNLYGICPCKNQIKNIGVDDDSIHGGNNFQNIMTKRFCGMDSYSIDFPLNHPECLLVDEQFENKIGKILLYPWKIRVRHNFLRFIKKIFKIPHNQSIKNFFFKKGIK